MLPVLMQPRRDCRRGHAATRLLPQASCRHLDAVTEVIVTKRGEDRPQGIGLVPQCRRAGCEHALAGGATPKLNDLEFLFAYAASCQMAAAAVGARVGYFSGVGNTSDAGERRHI
jgi:hypothetical protein